MRFPSILALLSIAMIGAACGSGTNVAAGTAPAPDPTAVAAAAQADSVRQYYTQADIDFMMGMIHHHAQALVMSRMAPTHGASPTMQTLAARIINTQRDEIRLMQRWLRERGQPAPDVDETGHIRAAGEGDHGMHHPGAGGHGADGMAMAGMLTPAQLQRLDEARGPEWDRLFLTYMIQHHRGARVMVDQLFSTDGAAQADETFRIASGIDADQASEIDRMQRMLEALLFDSGNQP